MKLTLTLTPLPTLRDDELPRKCRQELRKDTWPYVRICGKEPAGAVPIEVADFFRLDRRTICQEHADQLAEDIPQDSNLKRYVRVVSEPQSHEQQVAEAIREVYGNED